MSKVPFYILKFIGEKKKKKKKIVERDSTSVLARLSEQLRQCLEETRE